MIESFILRQLLNKLRQLGALPTEFEVGKIGPYHTVNIVDFKLSEDEFMKGNVSTGMSQNQVTAWLKAISEWLERKAFLENKDLNTVRFVRGSDGFAAFPRMTGLSGIAKNKARQNAVGEAIERFVWAHWWDNLSFANIKELPPSHKLNALVRNLISQDLEVESLTDIRPAFSGDQKSSVVILFLKLKKYGYISGGACGITKQEDQVTERAFVELLRHTLGFKRMLHAASKGQTFYDKRLFFFGSGSGNDLVKDRLQSRSKNRVILSSPLYDSEMSHSLEKLACVHHFIFRDQPEFLEGPLERLCL